MGNVLFRGVKAKLYSPDGTKKQMGGVTLSYELLMAENQYSNIQTQAALPKEILDLIREIALSAWAKIDSNKISRGNFLKITQDPYESYAEFVGRIKDTLKIHVEDEEMRNFLVKSLAYRNANSAVD